MLHVVRTKSSVARDMQVAVLIPCCDEALSIAAVVADFQRALPGTPIHVYDNNSADDTGDRAAKAGALVASEPHQGKGHVLRRMFADIEADIYVLIDGDGTYDPGCAPGMIDMLLAENLDMVIGTRICTNPAAYRPLHRRGNALLNRMVAFLFEDRITDMMSGYRVFSRRFVKSFPATSSGFETETELTIHALELDMPLGQMPTPYRERMAGSCSKLRTWPDGLRILRTIVKLMLDQRPLQLFSIIAALLFTFAIALSLPLLAEYSNTGLVPRLPTAVLCTGIVLVSFLSLLCGLLLDSLALGRKEVKSLAYLSIPRPAAESHLPRR